MPAHRVSTPHRGVFVAFEGGEGAGQVHSGSGCCATGCRRTGYEVCSPTSPARPRSAPAARSCWTRRRRPRHRTEALLYAADKAEHVDTVVRPALDRGAVVITDRYVDSSLAYQGAGRQLATDEVERLARWATADLRPHLTVLLDVAPSSGLARFGEQRPAGGRVARFHERVRASFRALAQADPEHYSWSMRIRTGGDRGRGPGAAGRRCSSWPSGIPRVGNRDCLGDPVGRADDLMVAGSKWSGRRGCCGGGADRRVRAAGPG